MVSGGSARRLSLRAHQCHAVTMSVTRHHHQSPPSSLSPSSTLSPSSSSSAIAATYSLRQRRDVTGLMGSLYNRDPFDDFVADDSDSDDDDSDDAEADGAVGYDDGDDEGSSSDAPSDDDAAVDSAPPAPAALSK